MVGSLVIQHGNTNGESSIVFPSASDTTNNYAAVEFENDTTLKLISNNSTNSEIKFQTNGNDRVTIDSNGNVDITGNITAGSISNPSDIRYKENISTLKDPLEKICSIRGVGFNFKDNKKKHAGIIAQEVDLVIPEAVNKTNNDKWSVNYNTFIGYLIESVKVLNKENESKQTYIEKLESRLDKQEELINKLLEKVTI